MNQSHPNNTRTPRANRPPSRLEQARASLAQAQPRAHQPIQPPPEEPEQQEEETQQVEPARMQPQPRQSSMRPAPRAPMTQHGGSIREPRLTKTGAIDRRYTGFRDAPPEEVVNPNYTQPSRGEVDEQGRHWNLDNSPDRRWKEWRGISEEEAQQLMAERILTLRRR